MKRFLIFLAILYYVSCVFPCFSSTSPQYKEECYEKGVEDTHNNTCCFMVSPTDSKITACAELPKKEDERAAYISREYPQYKTYTAFCFASKLGENLLLLGLLILL